LGASVLRVPLKATSGFLSAICPIPSEKSYGQGKKGEQFWQAYAECAVFFRGARTAPNPAAGHAPVREISAARGIRSTPPGFSPATFEAMRRHAGARLLGWMARVNERGMFEKPRGIAVSIRCCDREGRRREYKDR